ncbi:serine hydrolase [soil metagenome]
MRILKSIGTGFRATIVVALALACHASSHTRDDARAPAAPYPHASEPIGTLRATYDGTLSPELAATTFRNIDRLLPTRTVHASSHPTLLSPASEPLGTVRIADKGSTYSLEQYLTLNRVAGLLVLQDGRIKTELYRLGATRQTRWMSMSVAKSITSTLIGAAIRQGKIGGVSDPVTRYVPALAGSAYDGVSVRDVLTMSSGVRWSETYTDPTSDRRRLLDAQISLTPGSAMRLMSALPRAAAPGTMNNYNTGETQVAAELLRHAVQEPLADYLADRIWQRYGMEADANWWLESPGGTEIGGSGFSAVLRDYARFGQFFLDGGIAGGEQILPEGWTREAGTPKTLAGGRTIDYGYLWWPGTSDVARRHHAFGAEGIHGEFVYIDPVAKAVIVVWSARPSPTQGAVVDDWAFFDAVVAALTTGS